MNENLKDAVEEFDMLGALTYTAQKTKEYVNEKIEKIELIPGPQGPEGPEGPQGPKGDKGDTPELAEWALAPEKPEYTAEEVGALPADTVLPKEDFVAEYGVTTYQEVLDAYNEGRICWVKKQNYLLPLQSSFSDRFYFGEYWSGARILEKTLLKKTGWDTGSMSYVIQDDKRTEITSSPSNIYIPTEKAVADALQALVGNESVSTQISSAISNLKTENISDLNVTATELNLLDGATSNIQSQLNNKSVLNHSHSASDISGTGGFLPIHPEQKYTLIPFIHNDIAFLLKRGGSCKVYSTNETDFTKIALTEENYFLEAKDKLFNCMQDYAVFNNTKDKTIIIDIGLHRGFRYNTQLYIDFGSIAWAAMDIKVYSRNINDTEYTLRGEIENNNKSYFLTDVDLSNKEIINIRIVLKRFIGNWDFTNGRIAQIGIRGFNSIGAAEGFVSRGGCEGIYGNLIPNKNSTINLGSSEKHWQTVYADNIIGALPSITEADVGKFLRISSEGKIIAEQLTNVSEVGA